MKLGKGFKVIGDVLRARCKLVGLSHLLFSFNLRRELEVLYVAALISVLQVAFLASSDYGFLLASVFQVRDGCLYSFCWHHSLDVFLG